MRSVEEVEEFFETDLLPRIRAAHERLDGARFERQPTKLPLQYKLGIVAAGVGIDIVLGGVGATLVALITAAFIDIGLTAKIAPLPSYDVKRELIGRIVAFLAPELEYGPDDRLPDRVLLDSGLWTVPYDVISGEDRVRGKLGSTGFDVSEIRIDKRYGRKTRRLFSGLLFVADFNKAFSSCTYVLPDATERHLGMAARALQDVASSAGRGELVALENPEFERYFRVHSEDPSEARYLLSPSLMRRIQRFRDNVNADMRLSFVGGRVYVLLEHPDDLFARVGVDQIDLPHLRQWLGELLFVTSLIEELDLNTRVWSKSDVPSQPKLTYADEDGRPASKRTSRGLALRAEPVPPASRISGAPRITRLFEAALAGHAPLWQVWLLVFGSAMLVTHGTRVLVQGEALPASLALCLSTLVELPLLFLLWRNARNTRWSGWTLLTRGVVLMTLLSLVSLAARFDP